MSNYAANITQLAKGGGKIFIVPLWCRSIWTPGWIVPGQGAWTTMTSTPA